jgi:membrane-associated phospholipid phosphatase
MKKIILFIKDNNHFLYLLVFIPLIVCFSLCGKYIEAKYFMHCFIDDHIPFVSVFVIPYLFWFAYMAIVFLYLGVKSKQDFIKLLIFTSLGMSISYLVFILHPSGQSLRPLIEPKGIFSLLVKFIYWIDPPINVCPSIHVLNAIGVHIALVNCNYVKGKIKIYSFISMSLICVSTMFIKQHSFIDVIWGSVLALILYICIYIIPKLFTINDINKKNVYDSKKIN